MRQLSKADTIIFLAGAALMVVGSAANVFQWLWAPYVFTMGAVAFVLMQLKQKYDGQSVAIRRLRRMVIFSDVLFLVSGALMFANQSNFLRLELLVYLRYIHNNWVITLLVAAILQLYTSHRISRELDKEAKNS